jgi:hypothetical protein
MKQSISDLRKTYKPEKVKCLFVAESPPESNDDEVRFFYNPRQERWDHMYRSVMKAVFPYFEYHPGEKNSWLRKFQGQGYYMIDATDIPINHCSASERRRALNDAVESKLREIGTLVSLETPLVLVKKNVFLAFNAPLRKAGYNVIHDSFLPFPSHGHQARFIAACGDCLRRQKGTSRCQQPHAPDRQKPGSR